MATGLNIIGRIGHKLFTNAELEKNLKQYASNMADPQINHHLKGEILHGSVYCSR